MSKISNTDFLFSAESEPEVSTKKTSLTPWPILIVDDEHEVHTVTTLALSNLQVLDRNLIFYHAYSAEEAIQLLKQRSDIALILLDVVMESDNAGLIAVQRIRDELKLDEVRIILRTGQPGFAPEERIVKQYDINDYKTKTELTRAKLVTSIISAIRSYQQIRTINQSRRGLVQIITAAANLLERQSLHSFSEGILTQIASLLGLPAEGIVCAQLEEDGKASDNIYVLGAAGEYAPFIKSQLEHINNNDVIAKIKQCLKHQQHVYSADSTVLYLGHNQYHAAVYITTNQPISELVQQLIELFLSNVSIGYENAALFQQLKNAAYIDPLTKIANRNEFIQLIEKELILDTTEDVIALVDIDHFSDINDGLGQETGDEVLMAVANRLTECFGLKAQIARVGGDVFGLIAADAELSSDNINAAFTQPFIISEHRLQLSVNIGLCRLKELKCKALSALKNVTIALNVAKKNLTTNYQYYQPDMGQQITGRLSLLRNLAYDFSQQKLQLWYQPQIALNGQKIVGVEALLRWPQDDGSYISPAVFIPLAEYSGLIVEIGDWVLKQACQKIKQFTAAGHAIRIAINVSMQQFRTATFVQSVMDNISYYGIDASQLEIEITESIVMDDPQAIIAALNQLKKLGVKVAIDDFGIGFSSLSYIQKLPLDRLKIDRSFIINLTTSTDRVIVETIIRLAKQLNLATIAEGVEEAEQQQLLTALGCDEMQGYYYAKPMPENELLLLLNKQQ